MAVKKANMLEELITVNNHITTELYRAWRSSLDPQLQMHTEGLHKGQSETWNGLKEMRFIRVGSELGSGGKTGMGSGEDKPES